jgi:hypothetical protein
MPAPDAQGRIILYPPKPYPIRMVAVPLLGAFAFSALASWKHAQKDEFGFVLYLAFAVPFLIFACFSAFARYRVVLDDEGVFGGSKMLGGRIGWGQIENIRLNPARRGSVFASRMKAGPRGPIKIGACVSTLAPLSTQETAALLLQLARQHHAPVTRITTKAEAQ